MTLFADPILISLILAVFAAVSAAGTSLVIGFHFEKLRRQTAALQNALGMQSVLSMHDQPLVQSDEEDWDDTKLSAIISKQEAGSAARLLNGHDPARHVRFV